MIELESVVPWGRSLDEYRRMFALSDVDLRGRVLGCADGPASFNAEATELGSTVTSCDPLYRFRAVEVRLRIEQTFATVIEQARRNAADFIWTDELPDVESLGRRRKTAMERFLLDFEPGRQQGRYRVAELPSLPFGDQQFDLAVCSHFLFLYCEQLSAAFHVQSLMELCRVSHEVRVFPLLEFNGRPARHLEPVMQQLADAGYDVWVERVTYEFQRGGNEQLRARREKRIDAVGASRGR